MKSSTDIDNAVENLSCIIHEASFLSTPNSNNNVNHAKRNGVVIYAEIRELICHKRRLRAK